MIVILIIFAFEFPLLVIGQTQSFFSKLPQCSLPCAGNETQRLQCSPLDSVCVCQKVVGAGLFDCFAHACMFESDVRSSVEAVESACANCTAESCPRGVAPNRDDARSLSAGAIAGIAIGVIVAVVGLCVGSFMLGARRKWRKHAGVVTNKREFD